MGEHKNVFIVNANQESLGILNELGHEAIAENNDWVSEAVKRDFKKHGNSPNLLNKIKGDQSNSKSLEMGVDDDLEYFED